MRFDSKFLTAATALGHGDMTRPRSALEMNPR